MKKILYVDDDSEVLDFCRVLLEPEGYRVETAKDGVEGLAAIERFKPDLVLLNILMPRMDGLTMLRTLRKNHPLKMPRVVMASDLCGIDNFDKAISMGAVDFLSYPITASEMMKVISEALDPTLSDARLKINAKFRHTMDAMDNAIKLGWFTNLLEWIRRLPLGELSDPQRQDLRSGLKSFYMGVGRDKVAAAKRALHRGMDSALIAMALARSL